MGGDIKDRQQKKLRFSWLDSEDFWARLPGELSKVHIDTSMLEPGEKALLVHQAQHSKGLDWWDKPHSLETEIDLCVLMFCR